MSEEDLKEFEEIGKITELITDFCGHNCIDCRHSTFKDGVYGCQAFGIASDLRKAGYRKIPEGSVVLSKEEYEQLMNDLINAECNLNHTRLQLEDERKETAKEIFEKLLERGGVRYNAFTDCWETNCSLPVIKQVAREYGVEVEE